jgi:uncharacterized membrane protein YqgA involved in biofilm formation
VLIGTLWGVRLRRRIPEEVFRRAVSVLILLLGIYMLVRGIRANAEFADLQPGTNLSSTPPRWA